MRPQTMAERLKALGFRPDTDDPDVWLHVLSELEFNRRIVSALTGGEDAEALLSRIGTSIGAAEVAARDLREHKTRCLAFQEMIEKQVQSYRNALVLLSQRLDVLEKKG